MFFGFLACLAANSLQIAFPLYGTARKYISMNPRRDGRRCYHPGMLDFNLTSMSSVRIKPTHKLVLLVCSSGSGTERTVHPKRFEKLSINVSLQCKLFKTGRRCAFGIVVERCFQHNGKRYRNPISPLPARHPLFHICNRVGCLTYYRSRAMLYHDTVFLR